VKIQVCTNYDPQGLGEATIGETIFTYMYLYWKETFEMIKTSGQFQSNLGILA
jgi:hypothetical protein